MDRVRRLLVDEGAAGNEVECAAAAGRCWDKLHTHLAPIVGAAGLQALLVRSAKLVDRKFSFLEAAVIQGSTKLRECLQAQDRSVATEAAVALFGTFLALLTSFIGEQLTTQVLRRAWPMLEEIAPQTAPKETKE
jgi:hypothetical protein